MVRWLILLLRILLGLTVSAGALAGLAVLAVMGLVSSDLPRLPARLDALAPPEQTLILDRNGVTLDRVGSSQRVTLDRISPYFIEALLATEDRRFYEHQGISKRALLRVMRDMLLRERAGGGSTLTQQLAKNLFYNFDRRIDRKLKEMLTAAAMEQRYSKDEILLAYCNTVSFGSGCLGVESASREYFGVGADRLSRAEAATLVGILNAPGRYHPRLHPERCLAKRNRILSNLLAEGRITEEELRQEAGLALGVRESTRTRFGHLRDLVMLELRQEFARQGLEAEAVSYSGLVVQTTIDVRVQDLARREIERQCSRLDENLLADSPLEGAFVAMDPYTGDILSLVGGRDHSRSAFNCATGRNRQPGSAFKPVFYYTALREGLSPLDLFADSMRVRGIGFGQEWAPRNWDLSEGPPMTAWRGMANSLNLVAADMLFSMDSTIASGNREGLLESVRQNAIRLGFDEERIEAVPSMILGAGSVSPLQLCGVYSTFVNEGIRVEPQLIRRVEDRRGGVVFSFQSGQRRVLDPVESYLVLDMLKGAVDQGTGRSLKSQSWRGELGGKTGTTNDYRDSWFCSVTPYMTTVSWIGHLDNRSMRYPGGIGGVTGGGGALKIFRGLVGELDRLYNTEAAFRVPQGVEFREVDTVSGREDASGTRVALRMIDY